MQAKPIVLTSNTYKKTKRMYSTDFAIQQLDSSMLGAVASFEQQAWPAHMAASHQSLKSRFELRHTMLGAWHNSQLIGLASWRLGWLDKDNQSLFPKNFTEFSGAPNSAPFNAAFVYNLGIHPDFRGKTSTTQLVHAVLNHAQQQGCQYVIGDGRCPSYRGSPTEGIPQRLNFKNALDNIILDDKTAELEDYLIDPILNFYYRLLKCEFLWVIPDFIPEDISSGGHRVIFCKTLS